MLLAGSLALGIGASVFFVPTSNSRVFDGSAPERVVGVASASLDFPSVNPSEMSAPLTLTLTGALTTDQVACNATSDLGVGLHVVSYWVSASNTVSIRLHNVDPVLPNDAPATTFACAIAR